MCIYKLTLSSVEEEDWNLQDNLDKTIGAEIDQEEDRCTVQDHVDILNDDEAFEILQSVKDEDWFVQDNLEKNIVAENKGGLITEDIFTLVPFSKNVSITLKFKSPQYKKLAPNALRFTY